MTERRPGRRPAFGRLARRLTATLVTFAALGAMLSVLIAAAGAIWLPMPASATIWASQDPEGRVAIDRLAPLPDHWNAPASASRSRRFALTRWVVNGLLRPDVSRSGAFSATRTEAGFPARCLVADRYWDSEAGDLSGGPWRSGVILGSVWRPWTHDPRRYNSILPIRPLAGGFAINTLVWGAATWLAFRGGRLARRAWRLRRGRCPNCGYPKPDDPAGGPLRCPECGAAWAG